MLKSSIFTSGSLHLELVNLVWFSLVDSSSDIHISRFTVTSRDEHIDGVNFVDIEFALIQLSLRIILERIVNVNIKHLI